MIVRKNPGGSQKSGLFMQSSESITLGHHSSTTYDLSFH